ncbi:MAG: hypothetical protein IKQ61_00280 [Spirochaetales bacterium]|nr:hypothetical protein [Spirochaetales bacterium]
MKSRIITVALTALLIMSVVGCPNDTQTGSNTSANNKITSLQTVIDKASDGETINLSEYADITDYNATINKTLTINGSSTSLNNAVLTVESSSTISGITNASVTASSALENGSLKISSSLLSSLVINGGGIGSIELSKVTVTDVTIDKQVSGTAQYVRLQVDETKISNLHLSSSALIDTDTSCDANNINITFGNNNADLNVAFRKTIELTTPNGKVKADFAMSGTEGDKDFYIIVNKNEKINPTFFNQVAGKLCQKPFVPYQDGKQFDFNNPIDDNMHFSDSSVNETDTVLYDYNGKTGYTFYKADANGNIDGDALVDKCQTNSFCFDQDGKLYVLKEHNEEDGTSIIWSNKTNFGRDGELNVGANLEAIAYDRAAGKLYGRINVNTICAINVNNGGDVTPNYQFDGLEMLSEPFAVDNNIIYICYYNDEAQPSGTTNNSKRKLIMSDINGASPSNDGSGSFILPHDNSADISVGGDITGTVTDITYQDGAVYMLLRDYDLQYGQWGTDGIHSRGAVIKYDTANKSTVASGWENNKIVYNNMYLVGEDGQTLYDDENCTNISILRGDVTYDGISDAGESQCKEKFPNVYAPTFKNDQFENSFYGPTKFVGIKPKKLVIADDGLAFYTDEAGALVFKNVNRIVTVDLENFADSSQFSSISTDAVFDNDDSVIKDQSCADSQYDSSVIPDCYLDNTDYDGNIYLGIKKSDD